jgi:hypothetical protein
VILQTPSIHYSDAGGNPAYRREAYEKALADKNFREAYFQRTGKQWQEQGENAPNAKTPPEPPPEEFDLSSEQCLAVLDLKPGFSEQELKQAYKKAIKMNHPDKVAALSTEFVALAEKRTKQINQAFAKLQKSK